MATSHTTRRQNARRLMILKDITTVEAAKEIGVSAGHLYSVLAGRVRPQQAIRDKLPALLGVTLEECFDDELLAKEYGGRRGRRPAVSPAPQDREDRNDA